MLRFRSELGSQADVLRLARSQERELRDWLYSDITRDPDNLVARMKSVAAEIEDAYGEAIDVVAVGDAPVGQRHEALVQAGREALLNAVRHAGGPVSLYVEASEAGCDVYVRDRGSGFDPRQVPADRLGVRESIVGRMERYGGAAAIKTDANGTEIHLSLPAADQGETS